jgi:uridine kinase
MCLLWERMPKRAFIVGLAGLSGTGKSTIAKHVASRLNGHTVSMERYSLSQNGLLLEQREKVNYDEPDVIDVKLLQNHIREYSAGQSIESPVYDFANHLRVCESCEHVPASPLLIVEGILALHFIELRSGYDLSIYLEAPDDVCFRRRQVRDITERQRSVNLIRWQWENAVMPAAQRYVLPSKRLADVVIDSSSDLATVEKKLEEIILQRRSRAAANAGGD